jgi:hypothetical protein
MYILNEKPSPSAVRIGRLERRVEKLKKQLAARDALIQKHDGMMARYPDIARQVAKLGTRFDELERVRVLEERCKEQAVLIVLLQKRGL